MSNKINNPFALIKLAKTTTVCFDKSEICDGELVIKNLVILDPKNSESQVSQIIANVVNTTNEENPLIKALKKQYDFEQSSVVKAVLPYDQEKHLFGATFNGDKTFIIGLIENVALKNKTSILKKCEEFLGQDVYVLGQATGEVIDNSYNNEMDAIALIVVKEKIEESIPSSIKWLKENNINVKLLSSEDAQKAASIAYEAEMESANRFTSLEGVSIEQTKTMVNQYTVFGDVSKEQRETIINSLENNGEKVLRYKKSFGDVPSIIENSRLFVNNLQRVGLLFIAKAILAVLLTLIFVFVTVSKAFEFPLNLYRFFIFSLIVDIITAVLLMFDKSQKESKDKFLMKVLKTSLPGAILMALSVAVMFILFVLQQKNMVDLGIYNNQAASAMSAVSLAILGLPILYNICTPLTKYRRLIVSGSVLLIAIVLVISAVISYTSNKTSPLFGIAFMEMNGPAYFAVGMTATLLAGLYFLLYKIFRKDEQNEN